MTRLDPGQRYRLLAECLNYAVEAMRLAPVASTIADTHQGDGSINLGLQDRAVGAMIEFCEDLSACDLKRGRRRQTVVGFEVDVGFMRPGEALEVGSTVKAPGQCCLPWRTGLAYHFRMQRERDDIEATLAEYSDETGEVLRTWEHPFDVSLPGSPSAPTDPTSPPPPDLPDGDDLGDRSVDFGTEQDATGDAGSK